MEARTLVLQLPKSSLTPGWITEICPRWGQDATLHLKADTTEFNNAGAGKPYHLAERQLPDRFPPCRRDDDLTTSRTGSPQSLSHYADGWQRRRMTTGLRNSASR